MICTRRYPTAASDPAFRVQAAEARPTLEFLFDRALEDEQEVRKGGWVDGYGVRGKAFGTLGF